MAEIITEVLTCDLTGKKDSSVQTITFSVDGVTYEMELAALPMNNFRRTLQKHIDKARVVEKAVVKNTTRKGKGTGEKKVSESGKIREWARANGYTVGDRGRIHADIQAAYKAAMGNGPAVPEGATVLKEEKVSDVVNAVKDSLAEQVAATENDHKQDETPGTEDAEGFWTPSDESGEGSAGQQDESK